MSPQRSSLVLSAKVHGTEILATDTRQLAPPIDRPQEPGWASPSRTSLSSCIAGRSLYPIRISEELASRYCCRSSAPAAWSPQRPRSCMTGVRSKASSRSCACPVPPRRRCGEDGEDGANGLYPRCAFGRVQACKLSDGRQWPSHDRDEHSNEHPDQWIVEAARRGLVHDMRSPHQPSDDRRVTHASSRGAFVTSVGIEQGNDRRVTNIENVDRPASLQVNDDDRGTP